MSHIWQTTKKIVSLAILPLLLIGCNEQTPKTTEQTRKTRAQVSVQVMVEEPLTPTIRTMGEIQSAKSICRQTSLHPWRAYLLKKDIGSGVESFLSNWTLPSYNYDLMLRSKLYKKLKAAWQKQLITSNAGKFWPYQIAKGGLSLKHDECRKK